MPLLLRSNSLCFSSVLLFFSLFLSFSASLYLSLSVSRLTAQWAGMHHAVFDKKKRQKFLRAFWAVNALMLVLVMVCYTGVLGGLPGNTEAWALWGSLSMCLVSAAG